MLSYQNIQQALIAISVFGLFTITHADQNFQAKSVTGSINFDFILAANTKTNCAQLCFVQAPTCSCSYFDDGTNLCYVLLNSSQLNQTGQLLIPNDRKMVSIMPLAKDCAALFKCGFNQTGVYTIFDDGDPIEVYCDMLTDGGGWTVLQTRKDGSEDFYRGWKDYKQGFGKLEGEFWLGNDNLHRLTTNGIYQLRVDLEDTNGDQRYALYEDFSVASENDGYRLSFGNYSGDAGDSLTVHLGRMFTTKDRDYDASPSSTNCAQQWKGGWWYEHCHQVNLNGLYRPGQYGPEGIIWFGFRGAHYSLKRASMKFRPVGFKYA